VKIKGRFIVPKIINTCIGLDLLELFEHITGVRFFWDTVCVKQTASNYRKLYYRTTQELFPRIVSLITKSANQQFVDKRIYTTFIDVDNSTIKSSCLNTTKSYWRRNTVDYKYLGHT